MMDITSFGRTMLQEETYSPSIVIFVVLKSWLSGDGEMI